MDRRLASLGLALGVCVAAAQADTYQVRGRDRAGAALSGTVEVTASASEDGEVARHVRVSLGALAVEGSLSESGELQLGPSEDPASTEAPAAGAGSATSEVGTPGVAGTLDAESGGAAARPGASPGAAAYMSRVASGQLELKDGRLRLELRDAEGKALIRVSGTRSDAPAAATEGAGGAPLGAAGSGSGGGSNALGSASANSPPTPTAPESKSSGSQSKLDAAEERVALATKKLGERESERREEDEYAANANDALDGGAGFGQLSVDEGLSAAWDALREEHEAAVAERDSLQEQARSEAFAAGDLGAAEELVASNTRRLGDATRGLEGSDVVSAAAKAEQQRLREHQAQAQQLRDNLQQREQRRVVEGRDLKRAEDLVRENTERLASSQVALADDEEVTDEERAEHERLLELQRQAAEARDYVHDKSVRAILEGDDLGGAEQLVEGTTARLAASERGLEDAWDEATSLRDEHERLLWHHTNAVELRGHVLREARQRALERKDLPAANGMASSAVAQLAALEQAQGDGSPLTAVEREEHERLRSNYRDAIGLRGSLHRKAIKSAGEQKGLAAAQQLVAEDSAQLAAFAVANQHRAQSLTAVEQTEGAALIEFQQDAIALRTQLFERSMQDVRLWRDPQRAQEFVRATRNSVTQFEAALARRGLTNAPLPQVVLEQRETLAKQLRSAESLARWVREAK